MSLLVSPARWQPGNDTLPLFSLLTARDEKLGGSLGRRLETVPQISLGKSHDL